MCALVPPLLFSLELPLIWPPFQPLHWNDSLQVHWQLPCSSPCILRPPLTCHLRSICHNWSLSAPWNTFFSLNSPGPLPRPLCWSLLLCPTSEQCHTPELRSCLTLMFQSFYPSGVLCPADACLWRSSFPAFLNSSSSFRFPFSGVSGGSRNKNIFSTCHV